jgi:hypothetical protein
MTVNEGTVIAENYKISAKTKVIDGHTYLINREGESKIVLNLDALNLFTGMFRTWTRKSLLWRMSSQKLETLQENALQSREGLKAETVKVEKDIRCLQTSPSECSLYSEKILVGRGLPWLWGNPRYPTSMVVELQKYLLERSEELIGKMELTLMRSSRNLRTTA